MDSSAYSFRRALPRSIGHAAGGSVTATHRPRYGHDARTRRDNCHNLFSRSCGFRFIRRSLIRSRWPEEGISVWPRVVYNCFISYISRFLVRRASHSTGCNRTLRRHTFHNRIVVRGRLLSIPTAWPSHGCPFDGLFRSNCCWSTRRCTHRLALWLALGLCVFVNSCSIDACTHCLTLATRNQADATSPTSPHVQ